MKISDVAQLVVAFVAGINLPVIFVVIRRLGQIRDHLAVLNGRVGRVEEWKGNHTREDDRAHEDIKELWTAVDKIRDR